MIDLDSIPVDVLLERGRESTLWRAHSQLKKPMVDRCSDMMQKLGRIHKCGQSEALSDIRKALIEAQQVQAEAYALIAAMREIESIAMQKAEQKAKGEA